MRAACARAERRRRRSELLRLVALEGYDQRLPSELSGGQQQRVALARALAHEPRVLLLDEPFGALDAKIREELRRAIREIQRAVGITTMLVTHDQEEAFSMADRIGVMDRGRLQEVGEPRALYQRPGTRFVATFLGGANLLLGPLRISRRAARRVVLRGRSLVRRAAQRRRSGRRRAARGRRARADARSAERCRWSARPRSSRCKFVGASERLRLEMAGDRDARERAAAGCRHVLDRGCAHGARRRGPCRSTLGQKVYVGFKQMHALPTPISSLRLVATRRTHDGQHRAHAARAAARGAHAHRAVALRRRRRQPEERRAGCRLSPLDRGRQVGRRRSICSKAARAKSCCSQRRSRASSAW